MIFIDSNIPMYLVGTEHPQKKAPLGDCLNRALIAMNGSLPVRKYCRKFCIGTWQLVGATPSNRPLMHCSMSSTRCTPSKRRDVERAKTLLQGVTAISAREALHVAVMQRYDISRIMSFDAGFDRVTTIERVSE